jgi:hypothetical protein
MRYGCDSPATGIDIVAPYAVCAVGANDTDSTHACPGAIVVPAQPLATKPPDVNVGACTVSDALPSLASVTAVGADDAPAATLPNASVRGSEHSNPADWPAAGP